MCVMVEMAKSSNTAFHRSHTLPGIESVMENGKSTEMGGKMWERAEEMVAFSSPP